MGTTVRTVCSYCGVGCGIVLDVGAGPDGRRTVAARRPATRRTRRTAAGCAPRARPRADMLAAPRPADHRAGAAPSAAPSRYPPPVDDGDRRDRRGGCARSSTSTGPDARRPLRVGADDAWRRSTWRTSWPRASSRTNQIESNSRLCMASAGTGYKLSLGADGPPGSYEDFDHADVFLVIGSNMADCHPILFLRMMDRVKAGAKLIVVDPRRTATADKADLFLQIKPGHRPGAAQRPAAPAASRTAHTDAGVHRRAHRGLGGDAGLPRRLPARRRSPRSPASRRPTSARRPRLIGEAAASG